MEGIKRIPIIRTIAIKDKTITFGSEMINTPQKASELAKEILRNADRECLLVCCLDTKCHPVSLEIVGVGTINSCLAMPRDVFKNAILSNAAFIILFHNHVSGDPEPSKEDIAVTIKLRQAGEFLGVPLIDHIVIGDDCYYSLREEKGWNVGKNKYDYCCK